MKNLFKLPIVFLILFSANLLALTDDETALFRAVQNGDTDNIKSLILSEVDVNIVDDEGYTPLHRAVLYNKLQSVNELLAYAKTDKEARLPKTIIINDWYMYGATPLILASYLGYTEIVESLIKYKADIKARDNVDGTMAIHVAVANGHIEVAQLLLLKDKKLARALDNHGSSPLHWASMHDNSDIVAMLLQNGADANIEDVNGVKAIDYAKNVSKNEDIIALLLKETKPSDTIIDTTIDETTSIGIIGGADNPTAIVLVKPPIDTQDAKIDETDIKTDNTDEKADIFFTINTVDKTDEVIKTTIINPSVKNLELIVAAKEGDIMSIKRLISEGINPNFILENGYTPLHIATTENKIESIQELLLYEDLDIDIMGNIAELSNWEFGYSTPLFLASALGNDQIVSLLLDNNADIYYKHKNAGIMPIHIAAYNKHANVVGMLIEKDNSAINTYSDDFRTALHYAVMSESAELTSMLLAYDDINYDTKDILGKTPLHYAVVVNNLEIVKLLVNSNADRTIEDEDGYTPYQLAVSLSRDDIIDFLEDKGSGKKKWWKIK